MVIINLQIKYKIMSSFIAEITDKLYIGNFSAALDPEIITTYKISFIINKIIATYNLNFLNIF